MTENPRPGVYVILPEGISVRCPEDLNAAAQELARELFNFVTFIENFCDLDEEEATVVTAAILVELPTLFRENPQVIGVIKNAVMKARRNQP